MSLYAIDQLVWVKSHKMLGVISEANYTPRATYVVQLRPRVAVLASEDWMCGSKDLRAADWCCDGCGRWLPGHAYRTAPDGEYANGLSFCFLCVEVGL